MQCTLQSARRSMPSLFPGGAFFLYHSVLQASGFDLVNLING